MLFLKFMDLRKVFRDPPFKDGGFVLGMMENSSKREKAVRGPNERMICKNEGLFPFGLPPRRKILQGIPLGEITPVGMEMDHATQLFKRFFARGGPGGKKKKQRKEET